MLLHNSVSSVKGNFQFGGSGMITIKLFHNGEIRRIKISRDCLFADFCAFISKITSIREEDLKFYFLDQDKDWIRFSDVTEWDTLKDLIFSENNFLVKIKVESKIPEQREKNSKIENVPTRLTSGLSTESSLSTPSEQPYMSVSDMSFSNMSSAPYHSSRNGYNYNPSDKGNTKISFGVDSNDVQNLSRSISSRFESNDNVSPSNAIEKKAENRLPSEVRLSPLFASWRNMSSNDTKDHGKSLNYNNLEKNTLNSTLGSDFQSSTSTEHTKSPSSAELSMGSKYLTEMQKKDMDKFVGLDRFGSKPYEPENFIPPPSYDSLDPHTDADSINDTDTEEEKLQKKVNTLVSAGLGKPDEIRDLLLAYDGNVSKVAKVLKQA